MKLANVIVDVPAYAVDQTYTYQIPSQMEGVIEPGMRVFVPFGSMKRLGFVIEIVDGETFEGIKEIAELIDVVPVVTKEMIEIAKYMKEEIICYWISAFQAMLPASMKANYEKEVILLNPNLVNTLPDNLREMLSKGSVDGSVLEKEGVTLSQLKPFVLNGALDVVIKAKVKEKAKFIRVVRKNWSNFKIAEYREGLSSRSQKRKDLCTLVMDQTDDVMLSFYTKEHKIASSMLNDLAAEGIISIDEVEQYRDPYGHHTFERQQPLTLTDEQQIVVDGIKNNIISNTQETILIHGVTGSGKTEVYLQSIQKALDMGKEAIVLVPEISLTPQIVKRFKARFGDKVAVLHSGLSTGEKYDEWRKILHKEVSVVVGARSAVFAPFTNLGIIIIDEEHEATYKQDDQPRYDARQIAIFRGKFNNCPVVLGSATPSLESYARALKGVYKHYELLQRVHGKPLPAVEIVDMRDELKDHNMSVFSKSLFNKIANRLEKKEQTVLLLNRRGYSTFMICRECGYVCECPHCDVSLTYHKASEQLKCHYCGYEEQNPTRCPSCTSKHIRYFGMGTQKIEEDLKQFFPEARVVRMDVDTTRRKGAHEKLLQIFENEEADILLGTQMIAKGLDFPKVTLVGILSADSSLHIQDIRAAERTFQLLTQVSGRAGRHDLPGEVVVQTYTPDHYSIIHASNHEYVPFFHQEMHMRKVMQAPPYFYLGSVMVTSTELTKAFAYASKIVEKLRKGVDEGTVILGPVAPGIARVQNKYRYQCVIKYKKNEKLKETLRKIQFDFQKEIAKGNLTISIDLQASTLM